MLSKSALSLALALSLAGLGVASAATAPVNLPPVLSNIVKQTGVRVLREFPALGHMKGWVLMHANQPAIAYTTRDGKALLFGAMVTSKGENMTAAYMQKYAPKPDLSALMKKLKSKGSVITLGNKDSSHVLYTFEDPNCIFCHLMDIELKPYIQAGLQVRLIPVGFLKKSSAGKAAAIMQAANPAAAWAADEANFNEAQEEGAAVPLAHPKASTVQALENNLKLMQQFGFNGTPGVIYKSGNHWATLNGMPKIAQLPSMTGLPAQKETNPQLARFQ